MYELQGMSYMKRKLSEKEIRVNLRYRYYEMKYRTRDFGISTPPSLMWMQSILGWCAKAVDSISDRLTFREFENDAYNMGEIYWANNADILFDSAMLSALIGGCSFISITPDRMQVIDGANATGCVDPSTGMLLEGYAVLDRDKNGKVIEEAYFVPGETEIYQHGKLVDIINNPSEHPMLVPIINRPDAKRNFGHSRISRSCMNIIQGAARTVKRSEISAEFYSFPQKYAVGTAQDAETMDKWKASMSAMIEFSKDDDGDRPTLGQFSQQSMSPHMEQLKMFAAMFAGETGLTVDDLGFVSDNPSSAEAIKASHENLRLIARKAQRDFSVGFLNAGYLAACQRDGFAYDRSIINNTRILWEPIFEPDAAMLSGIGDGIIKINQAVPGYFGVKNVRSLTGIEAETEV